MVMIYSCCLFTDSNLANDGWVYFDMINGALIIILLWRKPVLNLPIVVF